MMQILSLAAGSPSTLLDWNNNYGDEQDKCILFHCGPVPQSMMTAKGQVTDHAILKNVVGDGCFFGCAGVARIDGLQEKLRTIGYAGYRHHVALTTGHIMEPAVEAMEKYLGYEVLKL